MSRRERIGAGGGTARRLAPEASGAGRARWPPRADVAVVLAIFVPGFGHLYSRRPRAAAIWLLAVLGAYWAVYWLGLPLHLLSIISAGQAPAAPPGARGSRGRPANP